MSEVLLYESVSFRAGKRPVSEDVCTDWDRARVLTSQHASWGVPGSHQHAPSRSLSRSRPPSFSLCANIQKNTQGGAPPLN